MKIISLSLRDFGIISSKDFVFPDGIFVFSGNNGEGKSTVLKAVSLLLFNKTVDKLSDYIQWNKPFASVECSFIHNNQTFDASIIINSKSTERTLFCKETGEEWTSNSSVTEKLNDLLDTKRALSSIVSFEHEVDLINILPSERREYLKKVYDLNFKKELEQISADISDFKELGIELLTKKGSLEQLEFTLQILERTLMTEKVYVESLDTNQVWLKRIETHKLDIERYKILLTEIRSVKKQIDHLVIERIDVAKQEEMVEKDTIDLKLQQDTLEKETFESVKNQYDEKKKKLQETLDTLSEKLVQDTHLVETEFPKSLNKLSFSKIEHQELLVGLASKLNKLELISDRNKSLSTGICPVCGNSFDTLSLNDFLEEENSLNLEIEKDREAVKKSTEKKTEYEKITTDFELVSFSCISNQKEKKNLLERLEEIDQDCDKILVEKEKERQEKLSWIIKEMSNKTFQLEYAVRRFEALNVEILELENKVIQEDKINQSIFKEEKEMSSLKEELISLQQKIKNYEIIETENTLKREINKEIEKKSIERDIHLKETIKLYEKSQKKLSTSELAKSILSRDFPAFILSQLVKKVEILANDFLSKVYPKYKLKFVETKNALSIKYNDKISVKLASGFEKQIFSFAYKYALGKFQNYNILFLDEVDSAASEENSLRFYEILASMKNIFKQIFVITHKLNIKELLTNDFDATVFEVQNGIVTEGV